MRQTPGLAVLRVIHSRYAHNSCVHSFPGFTRKMPSTFCLIMPYSCIRFFASPYCLYSRSFSSASRLYSAFRAYRSGSFFHALFFQGLCRSFIENQRAFMLTPELCLILCFAVFHRHGPELLIRGDVLYQHRHIRKPVFHSFEGSGGLVAGGGDLGHSAFQIRVGVYPVFRQEIQSLCSLLYVQRVVSP